MAFYNAGLSDLFDQVEILFILTPNTNPIPQIWPYKIYKKSKILGTIADSERFYETYRKLYV